MNIIPGKIINTRFITGYLMIKIDSSSSDGKINRIISAKNEISISF